MRGMARRAWAAAGHAAQITDHSKLATAQAFCTQLENGVLELASRPDPRELLHRCDTKRHMLGGTGLHAWRFMMGALAQGINTGTFIARSATVAFLQWQLLKCAAMQ